MNTNFYSIAITCATAEEHAFMVASLRRATEIWEEVQAQKDPSLFRNWNLSVHVSSLLEKYKVSKVKDLLQIGRSEFCNYTGVGKSAMNELDIALFSAGFDDHWQGS